MRYSPALTGLRGIAVVTVMWVHAAFQSKVALPGGFFTVDIFFVLSAFLITALLVAEFEARDRIDLKSFYARRGLRLLPALGLLLVLVAVLRLTVGPVGTGLGSQAVATVLYVANWLEIARPDQTNYLDHAWSLSVEEQFYFVWPLILFLLLRKGSRPERIARWTAGLALLAFLTRWGVHHLHPGHGPNAFKAYYVNSFARADELLIGVTLGLQPRTVWQQVGRLGVPAFLGLVLFIHIGRLRAGLIYDWGLTLSAVLAVCVVASCATGEGPVGRVLAWRPFVAAGTISYGLYLYHLPIVLALLTFHLSVWPRIVLGMLLPFPLAIASWFLVEKRALRLKKRFEPARVAA
jgi:peptidoglycan/LPS O-acetylase OafA/YrhL